MIFTFEECELINSFLEISNNKPTRGIFIKILDNAKSNTTETELISITDGAINKLKSLSDEVFINIANDLPINNYNKY